jgi:hypothetical protein
VTLVASAEDRPLVDGVVPAGLTVAFGAEPADGATVRFAAERVSAGELLVAPDGRELWRRSPWPAADALFELAPPAPSAPTLVVGGRSEEALAALRECDVEAIAADRLRREELARAGTVVFVVDDGFPALLPAAAAAGRLVVALETGRLFGWQDGVDCVVAPDVANLARAVAAAARRPRAFDALRAMARLAARPYRASDFYGRLALDVSLGVGVGPA